MEHGDEYHAHDAQKFDVELRIGLLGRFCRRDEV